MAEPSIPPTAYAILGLLSFRGELSGYDLRKWADHSIATFYWSPAPSQIYAELRRLRDLGLADEREVAHDDLRNKRVYRITDAGREALRGWVAATGEPPVIKHTPMLKIWAGQVADHAELVAVVDAYEAWCAERLERLRAMANEAATTDEWMYPAVVARWGVRHWTAELDNVRELRQDLLAVRDGTPWRSDRRD